MGWVGAVAPPFAPFESLRTGFDFPQGERPHPTPLSWIPASAGMEARGKGVAGGGRAAAKGAGDHSGPHCAIMGTTLQED